MRHWLAVLVLALCGCSSASKEPAQPSPVPTYSPQPKRVYANICDETFSRYCDLEKVNTPSGQRCISANIEKFSGDCLHKLTVKKGAQ